MEIKTNKFLELWADFVAEFKGSLITESKKQAISLPMAKLALADAVLSWTSEYTINGRWLSNLIKENREQGLMVKEIITKDISLTEVKSPAGNKDYLNYVIPAGAGVAGYAVAHYAQLATLGTVCATAIPAVVAYPLVKSYLDKSKQNADTMVIDAYVAQLEKYKDAVLATLMAETN